MPFDGSGTFNRVMNWVNDAAAAIKIKADRHDAEDDNFAAGLSNTLTKDGQSQPTANIPMNGKRLINLGAPTTGTDAATKGYVDTQDGLNAPKASPTFTGKVVLPTGSAALAPLNFPASAAAPSAPVDGDIWADAAAGLRSRLAGVTYSYGRLEAAQTWTGVNTFLSTGNLFGAANGTGQVALQGNSVEVGINRTADGAAFYDLHGTTGTDYDARLIRNAGVNGSLQLVNQGTGGIAISSAGGTFTYNGVPILVTNIDRLDLAAGFGAGSYIGDGAKSGGATYQPTAAGGNFRLVQNSGAFNFTADADATVKSYTLLVLIQNTATAGAITFVGWSAITGDSLTTVNGNLFLCSIVKHGGIKTINIQALQ